MMIDDVNVKSKILPPPLLPFPKEECSLIQNPAFDAAKFRYNILLRALT